MFLGGGIIILKPKILTFHKLLAEVLTLFYFFGLGVKMDHVKEHCSLQKVI